MDINNMTRKEFDALRLNQCDKEIICTALVILPGRAGDMHDSGFRCMDFVAVDVHTPICRLSGVSDVLHIDGIGGFGNKWLEKYGCCPSLVPPSGWSIDCLPKSGLLRIWPASGRIICGWPLSSFEIFAQLSGMKEKSKGGK